MLTLIVADTKSFRKSHLNALVEEFSPNEIITFDDTLLAVSDLEQYIFPSLFNNGTSFIHAQFILDTKEKDLTAILLKKLIASPTMFVFEELVVSKPFLTNAKKQGAVVHVEEKIKSTKQENDRSEFYTIKTFSQNHMLSVIHIIFQLFYHDHLALFFHCIFKGSIVIIIRLFTIHLRLKHCGKMI